MSQPLLQSTEPAPSPEAFSWHSIPVNLFHLDQHAWAPGEIPTGEPQSCTTQTVPELLPAGSCAGPNSCNWLGVWAVPCSPLAGALGQTDLSEPDSVLHRTGHTHRAGIIHPCFFLTPVKMILGSVDETTYISSPGLSRDVVLHRHGRPALR